MLKNNIYNIDKEFEKIAKEVAVKNTSNVLFYSKAHVEVKASAAPTPLLKLKIRNTTEYLI